MKLHVEAMPGELAVKSEKLVRAIQSIIESEAPELYEALEKALPRKQSPLKFPVLRELDKQMQAAYKKRVDRMLKDVFAVIDEKPVEKSLDSVNYTADLMDKEQARYDAVKQEAYDVGYLDTDFAPGGALYGKSTNELIDIVKRERS